jgi:hypothetical protein
VEEVKKSVNPIVYKSASVRNLPVSVQSVLQHWSLVNMESEDPPFENPFEKEYNRVVSELAQQREDCETKIEELQRRIGSIEKGAGDKPGGKKIASGSGSRSPNHGDNSTLGTVRRGSNSTTVHGNGPSSNTTGSQAGNITRAGLSGTARVNASLGSTDSNAGHSGNTSFFPSGSGNDTIYPGSGSGNISSSYDNSTVPSGGGCTPCPILPEVCGPSSRDSALVTPEAVLVGAAATFLLLILAAAVAIIIRYLDSFTSGFLIVVIIVLVWYCSSMYPDAARRLGARAWGALRDTASSIVDRLLRRNHSEVKSMCIS